MTAAIEVFELGRTFGSGRSAVQALAGVSFRVEAGETVALLGVNGAGKTTLIKILSTLLLPTSGSARVLGSDVARDAKEVRRHIGVVFGGERGLYPRLSGRENLRFFGVLAGMSRAALRRRLPEMLEQVGLAEAADRRAETYSRGMKQRLHVAAALISQPRVLLLDEPTVGLDPTEADRLRDTVVELCAHGVSVLLTSHYLLDVERLASRVVMLQKGKATADLPLAEFAGRAGYAAFVAVRVRGPAPDASRLLAAGVSVDTCADTSDGVELTLRLPSWGAGVLGQLGALLEGCDVADVQVRPARLEEAFASFASAAGTALPG
jgi:ABC-2 type transport system ATP-binding protein